MRGVRSLRAALAILAIAFASAVAASCLPDDPYQRWQLLDGTIEADARWIYERTHFDPTPVDVLVIGPSRVEKAVSAPRLEAGLAARGLPVHVMNAALPEGGRNLNAAILQEVLTTKHPRLIVVGILEKPSRYGHPAFKYVAPADMVAFPGYLGDINYLSDVVYLPYRQMRLFIADLAPGMGGLTKTFDAARYGGAEHETTGGVILENGKTGSADLPAPPAKLAAGVRKLERGTNPPLLPPSLADVEFGDERHYIRQMVAMAQAHGAKLAFLYLPYYSSRSDIMDEAFYSRFGAVWNAAYLAPHADYFFDYGHLDKEGARSLTDWLTGRVADQLRPPPPSQPAA